MEINVKELKKIAKQSHTAEIIATSLAMRNRLSHNTMLDRFKTALKTSGERIDDKEYVSFWKALEATGVGRIIKGNAKMPDHFEWFYSLKEVGQIAVGEKDNIKKPAKQKANGKKEKNAPVPQTFVEATPTPEVPVKNDSTLFVSLENGSIFEIVIKNDFTKKDLSNIVKAIQKATAL